MDPHDLSPLVVVPPKNAASVADHAPVGRQIAPRWRVQRGYVVDEADLGEKVRHLPAQRWRQIRGESQGCCRHAGRCIASHRQFRRSRTGVSS